MSISATPVVGRPGKYWVAVGNQWDQPTVLYEGAKLQRLPSDEFLKGDLTKPHPSDKDRSIVLFQLDEAAGTLDLCTDTRHLSARKWRHRPDLLQPGW